MAVFTAITREQLESWLQPLDVGALHAFEGIPSGIENSNWFVSTAQGEWVLTLFERLSAEQLPFYLELMRHLAQRGIRCPAPIPDESGALMHLLGQKPATLVTRLNGRSITTPTPEQCGKVGAHLAKAHLAAQNFPIEQPNLRGLSWWIDTLPKVLPYLNPAQTELITRAVQEQQWFAQSALYLSLPHGPVHADLFRDNVLFDGDELGGFIDFYFAGCDTWLFDLAVTVNDWCLRPGVDESLESSSGALSEPHYLAMVQGYASECPFTESEITAWPVLMRAAALRFWMSRLFDFHLPRPAELLTPKDPSHFERILAHRYDAPPVLTTLSAGSP